MHITSPDVSRLSESAVSNQASGEQIPEAAVFARTYFGQCFCLRGAPKEGNTARVARLKPSHPAATRPPGVCVHGVLVSLSLSLSLFILQGVLRGAKGRQVGFGGANQRGSASGGAAQFD